MVKTSLSSAGAVGSNPQCRGVGLISGWEVGPHVPWGQKKKRKKDVIMSTPYWAASVSGKTLSGAREHSPFLSGEASLLAFTSIRV